MGARYWRISAIQTPGGALSVGALVLSDGTTDYAASVTSGDLTAGFRIEFDLAVSVAVTTLKLTAVTASGFPVSCLLESSADGILWNAIGGLIEAIVYPGDGAVKTIVVGDKYFSKTVLLLHGNGVNGSTLVVDSSSSAKTVTAHGTARISTDQSEYNGSSIVFDADGAYLSVPNDASLQFGTDAFTIEIDALLLSLSDTGTFVCRISGTYGIAYEWAFQIVNSTTLRFYIGARGVSSAVRDFTIPAISLGTWTTFSVGRDVKGVLRAGANGQLSANTYVNTEDLVGNLPLTVGVTDVGGVLYNPLRAHVAEIRLTKGVVRYTANYVVHTQPHLHATTGVVEPAVTTLGAPSGVVHLTSADLQDTVSACVASGVVTLDQLDGGYWRIVGTVAEKALPNNTPLQRRVVLIDERSHRVIRETWSDAAGNYAFNDISGGRTYTVLTYDHTGLYRAVIADNLSPTLP